MSRGPGFLWLPSSTVPQVPSRFLTPRSGLCQTVRAASMRRSVCAGHGRPGLEGPLLSAEWGMGEALLVPARPLPSPQHTDPPPTLCFQPGLSVQVTLLPTQGLASGLEADRCVTPLTQ